MLWETISKKLSEKNWTIYKLCRFRAVLFRMVPK